MTKRELLGYAARIAPVLLPYLRGRALNMHRYPDGAAKKGFWHKEVPNHAPEWLSPLAQRGRGPRGDPVLRRRGRAGDARLGGRLRGARVAPVDLAHRCA